MKGIWIFAVAALVAGRVAAASGTDREGERTDCVGWGPDSAYGRTFDPATIGTVRGEVVAIELVNPRKGMACGVCLELRTEEGRLRVHLGPYPYVARHAGWLALHDAVEVTGSRVVFKGAPALMATSLKMGDEILVLRGLRGLPAWGEEGAR
jgi:hypothetical protein